MAKMPPTTTPSPHLPLSSKPSFKKLSSAGWFSSHLISRTQKTPKIVPSFSFQSHSLPSNMLSVEMMMPISLPPTTTMSKMLTIAMDGKAAAANGNSFEGTKKRQRPTMVRTNSRMMTPLSSLFIFMICFLFAIFSINIQSAEGYNIDRLYNNGGNGGLSEAQQLAMLRQFQNADELWKSTKKSPEFNKLTKFNGNGARNCFFTPIQCMLQHDVNKLRRMVDPTDIGQVS